MKYPITKLGDEVSSQHWNWGTTLDELIGHWENANEATKLIINITLAQKKDGIYMTVIGEGTIIPTKPHEFQCHAYYDAVDSKIIEGFIAAVDFKFMESSFCFNVKKGVLTIQLYNHFKDESGRKDFFGRAFFIKK